MTRRRGAGACSRMYLFTCMTFLQLGVGVGVGNACMHLCAVMIFARATLRAVVYSTCVIFAHSY